MYVEKAYSTVDSDSSVSDGSMSAFGSAGAGSIPGGVEKFCFENFQPRSKDGWRCTLSNR